MPHFSATAEHTLRRVLVLSVLFLLPTRTPAAETPLRPFLDTYCLSCHDNLTRKGGLDLESLPADFHEPAAFQSWVKVHDRIKAGEMPPKARKERPAEAEAEAVVKWLKGALVEADRSRRSGEGRAVFRRLNRTEYENTLRDLLSVPGLTVKDLLPEDGRVCGYDKSAAGLDLSHVQLAKYLEAADVALDAAIAPHAARPALVKAHIPGGFRQLAVPAFNGQTVFLKNFKYDDSIIPIPHARMPKTPETQEAKRNLTTHPFQGSIGVLRSENPEFKPRFPFNVVYAGRYRIRMCVWSFWWDKGAVKPNPRTEAASLVAEGRTIGYFDAPSLEPTVTEIEVWLNPMSVPRDQIQFNAASLWPIYLDGNLADYAGPGIAVDWLEIEGPLLDQWPTAGHRLLLGDLPFVALPPTIKPRGKARGSEPLRDPRLPKRPPQNAYLLPRAHEKPFLTNLDSLPKAIEYATVASRAPEADASRLLGNFLKRAFRRPVTADLVKRYVEFVMTQLSAHVSFEVAMRRAYRAALSSPDFLFLKEPAGPLDDWAVACRLSYFLWNSMPDDELFSLAGQGRLRDPAVLRGQVERLLKDPKAERLVVDFTDQWLDLRDIDDTTPDKQLYPEFRSILRDSMLAEPRAFFRELLENDLPVTNVVHSDFAMLNQRLAEHYGIPGVEGTTLRRVRIPAESHRGGVLTQAAVLKVTANGTTTSPVKRGVWVERKLVGKPPEPPPANVPAIEPDVRGTTTVREMLARHRSSASCASCHAKIDPPGFALESFDVIGGWQTRYRSLGAGDPVPGERTGGRRVAYKLAQKIDTAGKTADDQSFDDIEGFKRILLANPAAVARNMVGQLVVYATGAPVGFADRAAVKQICDRTAATGYGLRSLIHEIVQSPLFLTK